MENLYGRKKGRRQRQPKDKGKEQRGLGLKIRSKLFSPKD
jgi:hypothetical protein